MSPWTLDVGQLSVAQWTSDPSSQPHSPAWHWSLCLVADIWGRSVSGRSLSQCSTSLAVPRGVALSCQRSSWSHQRGSWTLRRMRQTLAAPQWWVCRSRIGWTPSPHRGWGSPWVYLCHQLTGNATHPTEINSGSTVTFMVITTTYQLYKNHSYVHIWTLQ